MQHIKWLVAFVSIVNVCSAKCITKQATSWSSPPCTSFLQSKEGRQSGSDLVSVVNPYWPSHYIRVMLKWFIFSKPVLSIKTAAIIAALKILRWCNQIPSTYTMSVDHQNAQYSGNNFKSIHFLINFCTILWVITSICLAGFQCLGWVQPNLARIKGGAIQM